MKAKDHPEYNLENSALKNIIATINKIINMPKTKDLGGTDDWANYNLAKHYNYKRNRYRLQLDEPYFGRIDFEVDSTKSFYIGRLGMEANGISIIDWRAPIARLYYSSKAMKQSYSAPKGTISGNLILRRAFKIRNTILLEINDLLDYRDGYSQHVSEISTQLNLFDEIQDRGNIGMQDIVKTIQEEQDAIIRASKNSTIIIDGVAGSGKTSIALHRLAYLLFPEPDFIVKATNCIVFCPNKIFLHFIEDLLPGLGIQEVQQTTFVDWAFDQMKLTDFDCVDTPMEKFTIQDINKEELRTLWRRAQLKGSLRFASLLNNYYIYLKDIFTFPKQGITLEYSEDELITISWDCNYLNALKVKIAGTKETPLNILRQKVLERLRNNLDNRVNQTIKPLNNEAHKANRYKQYLNSSSTINKNKKRDKILADLRQQLEKNFNEIWKELKAVQLYFDILNDTELLSKCNLGIFKDEELKILNSSEFDGTSIELEDLPAILLFYILLNGVKNIQYDHIVIDEAQDFSPIMLKVIHQHNKFQSMTLAGDLSQSIYAYRGINNWNVLDQIFKETEYNITSVNTNYRNTKEIVDFTNGIFKELTPNKGKPLPISIGRSGPKPKLVKFSTKDEMLDAIKKEISYIKKVYQYNNIALITKSLLEAKDLDSSLRNSTFEISTKIIHDKEDKYEGGVVCLPIPFAKGLEFEAVIVIDASTHRYKYDVQYDGHLLYVAITRALHYLCIFSVGEITKYLKY